jgi:antitoxin VapB
MAIKTPNIDAPAQPAAAPADHNRTRDRRVVRTEDLSADEIAAVAASEMEGRFADLNAELDRPGISVVELGVEFCRRLRTRGLTAEGKLADKAFRDGLYEDT